MVKKVQAKKPDVSWNDVPESRLEARERRWAEAQKMTLFSNAFLSVALEDPLACQYVLRILLRKKDLIVKEVRTRQRVSGKGK